MGYTFSLAREGSCQWDSAVSEDGGRTWITDWVMQFNRTAVAAEADASNAAIERPPAAASDYPETAVLDNLIGVWAGTARALADDGTWLEGTAEARLSSMIEGFGIAQFLDTSWGEKTFTALGWETWSNEWVALRADSRELGLTRLTGSMEEGVATFTSEAGLRETWRRETTDRYSWQRLVRDESGGWRTVLEATLERR